MQNKYSKIAFIGGAALCCAHTYICAKPLVGEEMANALQHFLQQPAQAEVKLPMTLAKPSLVTVAEPMPMQKFFSATPLGVEQGVALQRKCADGSTHVHRYGKIFKRRAPNRKSNLLKMAPPGQRYCTQCGGYQPEDRFYPKSVRYMCRWHHFERVRRRRDELQEENPLIRVASIAHWVLKQDWRALLGRETMGYSEQDVYSLFKHVLDVKEDGSWIPCIVPLDPSKPMHLNNVAAVDKVVGKALVQLWTVSNSRALHITLVQAHNLIPPNANTCNPTHPYADPLYMRKDIDVVAIMKEEQESEPTMPRLDSRKEEKPPEPTPPKKLSHSNLEARNEERAKLLLTDPAKLAEKERRPKFLTSWSSVLQTVAVTK